jgi:manganese oxidase
MEEGMGMLRGAPGAPTGEDYGPSLGRGLGVGSTNDRPFSNSPLSQKNARAAMQDKQRTPEGMQGMQRGMHIEAEVSPDANSVPGFPQDAYMEGPMMAMDEMVEKPQNYGLKPGWSGFMQGMMTFVRVLPPTTYDEVTARIRQNESARPMMHDHM